MSLAIPPTMIRHRFGELILFYTYINWPCVAENTSSTKECDSNSDLLFMVSDVNYSLF